MCTSRCCAWRSDILFPSPEALLEQCGKLQLLDKLLKELRARKHKVLIFSQVREQLPDALSAVSRAACW